MNRLLLLLTYIIIAFAVNAQSNIRLNNYWGSMYYINPASVYDEYQAVFSMAARKQWVGVDGAPLSFFGSASTYLENYRTQLGLFLTQDKVGYTSLTNLNFSYGYSLKIDRYWQLHLGAGIDYQSVAFDLSKVSMKNQSDAVAYLGLASESAFNADIGTEIASKHFKMGLVSQNIFSLFSSNRPLQSNTNFVYGKYYQNSRDVVNWGAGICAIQYANIYQAEFNVTTYFKDNGSWGLSGKKDLFDIGLFYRTRSQAGIILGWNITDVFHVSYSYDYHFGSLRLGSYGTNEIILTYNLPGKEVCHDCWHK